MYLKGPFPIHVTGWITVLELHPGSAPNLPHPGSPPTSMVSTALAQGRAQDWRQFLRPKFRTDHLQRTSDFSKSLLILSTCSSGSEGLRNGLAEDGASHVDAHLVPSPSTPTPSADPDSPSSNHLSHLSLPPSFSQKTLSEHLLGAGSEHLLGAGSEPAPGISGNQCTARPHSLGGCR